ncbi:choice-of-anchor Q domain-containing protein [Jiulongibacter sediminis]|uniref:choice-of-anchor Q domain-containing protein n=1 Tax=Jiulongibacter sediminis TaxID=1605367 RepID=UPI0026ED640A|nr:choice-of-anchor Q domain-containing protein [Jiulongibacter sediminis]
MKKVPFLLEIKLALLSCFLFISFYSQGKIRYVAENSTGTGTSWADASGDLQAMIDASAPGDSVWVKGGTYKPNAYPTGSSGGSTNRDFAFTMKNQVKVFGSFAGTEFSLGQRTNKVMRLNASILSGDIGTLNDMSDNVYHVIISVSDDANTLLDGFTITKGQNQFNGVSITLENETLSTNDGPAINCTKSSLKIKNCSISLNKSTGYGGIYISYGYPLIDQCIFSKNEGGNGAGISLRYNSSGFVLSNSVFYQNEGGNGGAIWSVNSTGGIISNTVFLENIAYTGSVFGSQYGSCSMTNCTFYNNQSTFGGPFYSTGSTATVNNSILWSNNGAITAAVSYSIVEGGLTGTGNSGSDPLFVNTASPLGADGIWGTSDDGLAVQLCSPVVDSANNSLNSQPADIVGFNRIFNSLMDMGAYEIGLSSNAPLTTSDTLELYSSKGTINSWTGPNAFTSSIQNPSINILSTTNSGTYTVTITGTSCTSTATIAVSIVDPPSSPTLTTPANLITCAPDSITIYGSCNQGHIVWSDNSTLDSITIMNQGEHQVYAVCQSGDFFSISSDTIDVIINETIYANIITGIQNLVVCQPNSVVLKSSCLSGNTIWSDNSVLDSLVFTDAGIYDVYATCSDNGCISDTSSHVTVEIKELPAKPLIISSTSTYACAPDSVVLSTSCSSGTIVWSDLTTKNSVILKNADSYTYSVQCDLNGCINASDEINFEIKQSPAAPSLGLHSTQDLCTPDSLYFSAGCFGGGNVLWFNNTTDTLVIKTPGVYIPTAVCDDGFCHSDTTSWVNEYSLRETPANPNVELSATLTCAPDSIIIKANCSTGSPLWSDYSQLDSIVVKNSGVYSSYSVVCKSDDCISDTTFVPSFEIKSEPQISISGTSPICENETLYLSAYSALATFYSWSGPASSLDSFLVSENPVAGRYFINVQGTNGCNATDSIDIEVKQNLRIYVNATASGTNNGTSWTDAFTDLQSALDVQCYSEIWVAGGTYYPSKTTDGFTSGNHRAFTFKLRPGKKLYGGFAGTETDLSQRTKAVIRANPSILSGDLGIINDASDNAYSVVVISNDDTNGRLDGFTITNGYGDATGARSVNNRLIYLNNGAGISIDSSATTIANCTIKKNYVSNNGGGVYISNHSDITFIDCVIDSNSSATYGGGILALSGSKIAMERSVLSNNSSTFAGGLYSTEGAVILRNSLIYQNTASWYAGGVRIIDGDDNKSLIENNTFVKNISSYGGSAIEIQQTDSVRIINTIFNQNIKSTNANSYPEDVKFDNSGRKLFVENSLLQHELSEGVYPQNGGLSGFQFTNTFFNLPLLFKDIDQIAGADGILQTTDDGLIPELCSPTINTGTNAITTSLDFNSETRILQSQADIGAYETNHSPIPVSVTLGSDYNGPVCYGTELTFTASAQNVGIGVFYNFLVNGVSIQNGTSSTLIISTLNNNDSVSVYITYGICDAMSNTIKVIVNDYPVSTATDNFTVCQGQTFTFTANGGTSYIWSGPNNFSASYSGDSTFTFPNAQPVLTGTYYFTISNGFCESYDSLQVTVQNPTVTLSSSANGQICPGTTVSFQATIGDNFNANPYTIFAINGVEKQSGTNQTYSTSTLNDGDIVSVTVSDACLIYSNTITMDVADFASVSSPVLTSFCGGDTLKLYVSGGESYAWSGPNDFSSTEQNPKIANATEAMSGTYTVTVSIGSCSTQRLSVVAVSAFPYKSKLYVDADASGNNDGTNWTNAFTDFQSALDYGCFDTIWVAGGTYIPSKNLNGNTSVSVSRQRTFHLPSGKVIMGGFAGTETAFSQRDTATIALNPSILSGEQGTQGDVSDNSYHVVMVALEGSSAILDGFTIQDGTANGGSSDTLGSVYIKQSYGGGLISAYSGAQIRNITFKNNKAKYGAGFFNQAGGQTISNCLFMNNVADSTGGGLYNLGSNPTISNSKFIQNSAAGFGGGGIANASSSPNIDKCLFQLNSGRQGGGMGNALGSSPIVQNSFFLQNTASYAGGGFGTDGTGGGAAPLPKVVNCVFANNTATQFGGGVANNYAFPIITYSTFYGNAAGFYGGGVFNATSSISTITNSIFRNNIANFGGSDNYNFAGGSASISYSILQNAFSGTAIQVGVNPLFTDVTNPAGTDGIFWTMDDGFSLLIGSPAIDAGITNALTSTDILGRQRAYNGIPDLGPYEFTVEIQSPTAISASQTTVCTYKPFTLSATCETGFSPVWYNVATDGSPLQAGSPYQTSVGATTIYYVACENANLKSTRVFAAEIIVNPNPPAPTADAVQSFCAGATIADLQATGSDLTWTENKIVKQATDLLISSPNYRVTQTVNGCTSLYAFVEVILTSSPIPTISASSLQIGYGGSSMLTAAGCSGTVTWFPGAATGISLVVSPELSTTYTATCTENGCESGVSSGIEIVVSGISPCASQIQLQAGIDDISSGISLKTASAINGQIQANNKVLGTARVNYEAKFIELHPGFEASSGTVFLAETGGCN